MSKTKERNFSPSRRSVLQGSAVGGAALATTALDAFTAATPAVAADTPRSGAVGYTSFIHPTAQVGTAFFSIGAQSLIEGQVKLQGASTRLGNASDLQDNSRLLNFGNFPGDLVIGDGSFTAHNVTFIGRVVVGDAVGTVISAVVQNAIIGDASIVGFTAQILGTNPFAPIRIPDAHLVLFGARIKSQADVAANTIPIPAAFSLFASDVDSENVLLARAYNLLYRAAGRFTPFSSGPNDPGNPGANFPNLATAFGKFTVGPPTLDRRGTGVIPARQASLNDLGYQVFQPLAPPVTLNTAAPDKGGVDAPPSTAPRPGPGSSWRAWPRPISSTPRRCWWAAFSWRPACASARAPISMAATRRRSRSVPGR